MADTTQLTLYAETLWISPYVFSSFVALQEKRLTFDVVEVSLLEGAQQRPEYRDRSLTGKVPALQHGTFWLSESSAIAEYLDDVRPASPTGEASPGIVTSQPAPAGAGARHLHPKTSCMP